MLTLTRKTDYALLALVNLARRMPDRASARQVSEAIKAPLPMLMNVLKVMNSKGLVDSARGVKGGYRLSREPDEITLAEIIDVVEGPIQLTLCCGEPHGDDANCCELELTCQTKDPMRKVNAMLSQFLAQITLADIVSDTVPIIMSLSGSTVSRRKAVEQTVS